VTVNAWVQPGAESMLWVSNEGKDGRRKIFNQQRNMQLTGRLFRRLGSKKI